MCENLGGPERLPRLDLQPHCSSWMGKAGALGQRGCSPELVRLCVIVLSASQVENGATSFSILTRAQKFYLSKI